MKKLLMILALVFILSSCNGEQIKRYIFDEQFDDLFNSEPVISGFYGEIFGADITADGMFTGCEVLDLPGRLIYCNDDGAVIWNDYTKKSICRLDSRNQKKKICPDEECRNNTDGECGHLPINEFLYSDGYLYFAYAGQGIISTENKTGEIKDQTVSKYAFVCRYDLTDHEIEKLIEIPDAGNCVLALNGRYLYVQTYNWETSVASASIVQTYYKADYTITRIDLYEETAVVVYSYLADDEDYKNDKTDNGVKEWLFLDNKIIMPSNYKEEGWDKERERMEIVRIGSVINISTIDMRNFEELIDMEYETILFDSGGGLQFYNGEIYFLTGSLNRIDIKTGEREIISTRESLNAGIQSFSIDGDFLYYAVDGEYIYVESAGHYIAGDSTLYRIKLDYTRELNFREAVVIYGAEKEYSLTKNWKVHGSYLYALLKDGNYYRIKINSREEPYLLYKDIEND